MDKKTIDCDVKEIRKYLDFIKQVCPRITEEELAVHSRPLSVCRLKKRKHFINLGEMQENIGFVTNGLVRSFYTDAKGKEATQQIMPEGTFVSHYSSLLNNQPSRFFYQCLEDTTLVNIPFQSILDAYDYSHNFERFGRIIAEMICQRHHLRVESFLFETAEQRYHNFINDYPNLSKRVSITHLCSYLGMERQTLTRIRKKNYNEVIKAVK